MARIEDYALIGDQHTAALVSRRGSIDWLCLPRFDSPACFAALLDTPESGAWSLAPAAEGTCTERRYQPGTLVLETDWVTNEGTVQVIDFMPRRGEAPDIVRIVHCTAGSVAMRSDLRLRFDYGRIVPWVRRNAEGGITAVAGPDAVYLRTPAETHGADGPSTRSDFKVRAGDRVPFVLTWRASHEPRPTPVNVERALAETQEHWRSWSARAEIEGEYRDAVLRSLITLKALTYAPTGGIVAAVTTSLPERIGGTRNWDYRYCWLRDATLTLQSLITAGYTAEAGAWREWLLRAIAGDPSQLQIMYGLDGTRRLPEAELPWLAGYEQSTPVRTGNAASNQLQLDVWGEVLDSLALMRSSSLGASDDSWDLQSALMEHLEGAWDQPDNGLWEMRGPRRHFTHSKVMAWVAADRMVKGVECSGLPGPADRWKALRTTIRRDVLERGYDDARGTFTQSYGAPGLDASLLVIPRVGFLPYDDPRVVGTVRAIERELTEDGLVLRYRTDDADDGLPPGEGVFLACSFWLVDGLYGGGRRRDAVELFERLLTLRNDVGLLSEEWDPVCRRQLGNTPQAYSHFALIMSALQFHHECPHLTDTEPPPVDLS